MASQVDSVIKANVDWNEIVSFVVQKEWML